MYVNVCSVLVCAIPKSVTRGNTESRFCVEAFFSLGLRVSISNHGGRSAAGSRACNHSNKVYCVSGIQKVGRMQSLVEWKRAFVTSNHFDNDRTLLRRPFRESKNPELSLFRFAPSLLSSLPPIGVARRSLRRASAVARLAYSLRNPHLQMEARRIECV